MGRGSYARKQLFSVVPLIAWSHRSRFERALELARALAPTTLLDLGCGDGTFLAVLMRSSGRPRRAIGADSASAVADCRERLGRIPDLEFVEVEELAAPQHASRFDAVFCTEVLEHVVEPTVVLTSLERLLSPGGRLVISVPVETGPTLLLKQVARRLAGWTRVGDYAWTRPYSWRELARGVTAIHSRPFMTRPIHDGPFGPAHDHTGFNWRHLRALVASRFELLEVSGTPRHLPTGLGSQVWFVARRRA